MRYTKEQLIKAQHQYNNDYAANPDEFNTPETEDWTDIRTAENQIEYLLELIED